MAEKENPTQTSRLKIFCGVAMVLGLILGVRFGPVTLPSDGASRLWVRRRRHDAPPYLPELEKAPYLQ
jgi:hypothetical protein